VTPHATDFANWSKIKGKGGWDTLEDHHDPSRCAGVTLESGTTTQINLGNSNLDGDEFSLGQVPRYSRTTR
jgi:hypothetical protein